jgi:hypothetical protein
MQRAIFYAAVLIGLFLVIVYYRGSTSVINAGGSAIGKLILFLQGRDANGHITNYPQ